MTIVRHMGVRYETESMSLTMCNGAPNLAVLDQLSVLARPAGLARPTAAEMRAWSAPPPRRRKRNAPPPVVHDPAFVADQVIRLNPGLLSRIQRIAARFPNRAIEIVSGYRPNARETSRHHHGRALDMRVRGIDRIALRDFARTFDETGVGYYPNSTFVHVDVRDDRAYWVDRSGPGEAADYGQWPPPEHESRQARSNALALAERALEQLRPNVDLAPPSDAAPDADELAPE